MENKNDQRKPQSPLQESLAGFAGRLQQSRSLRRGDIILHLSGEGGGDYCLSCGPGQVKVQEASGLGFTAARSSDSPLLEVSGDARIIRDILDGKKDPLKQFLVGGLRIRGDLRHFSDFALEINLIDQPL
jgi:hypothetical protein